MIVKLLILLRYSFGYNKGGKGNGAANEAVMATALKLRAIVKTTKVTVDLG